MDNKLTETGSSNRRVAAVPIWVKPYLNSSYTPVGTACFSQFIIH